MSGWSSRLAAGLAAIGLRAEDHVAVDLPNRPEVVALRFALARERRLPRRPRPDRPGWDRRPKAAQERGTSRSCATSWSSAPRDRRRAGCPSPGSRATLPADGPGRSSGRVGHPLHLRHDGHAEGSSAHPRRTPPHGLLQRARARLRRRLAAALRAAAASRVRLRRGVSGRTLRRWRRPRPQHVRRHAGPERRGPSQYRRADLHPLDDLGPHRGGAVGTLRPHDTAHRLLLRRTAPLPMWAEMRDVLGAAELFTAYGQTETTASTVCTRPGDPTERLISTNGAPKPAGIAGDAALRGLIAEYTALDPATGATLPPGEVGELVVRGVALTRGYYNKPAETAAAFTADGRLRTGDLGMIDEQGTSSSPDESRRRTAVAGRS
ncbi:hypothetical protein L7F22_025020 [Adiantum nelumboides]|nr:hypothetical protein [Adiantum nelumboides]